MGEPPSDSTLKEDCVQAERLAVNDGIACVSRLTEEK
jgi:hypothetical protein